MDILERFKKYIAFDTMSNPSSENYPSSESELAFGKILVEDLKEIGLDNAYQDEFGLVYASININKERTIIITIQAAIVTIVSPVTVRSPPKFKAGILTTEVKTFGAAPKESKARFCKR